MHFTPVNEKQKRLDTKKTRLIVIVAISAAMSLGMILVAVLVKTDRVVAPDRAVERLQQFINR